MHGAATSIYGFAVTQQLELPEPHFRGRFYYGFDLSLGHGTILLNDNEFHYHLLDSRAACLAALVGRRLAPWKWLGERTMFQAFVITLREGLEAFLIVSITFAYLQKTKRYPLLSAVRWGITSSVLLSLGVAVLFRRASNQALWEGTLALVAAVLVISLTIHMWRVGRRIKGDIETRLEMAAGRAGARPWIGVFVFTLLMITREGTETVALFGALLFQVQSVDAITGAFVGILCAAAIAGLWARHGHRVNLGRFFQVSAVFLLVFSLQLVIYGFHELTEASVLPYSEPLHWATEPYGPDGRYGKSLSYLLVLLPVGWLVVASWMDRSSRRHTVANNELSGRAQ